MRTSAFCGPALADQYADSMSAHLSRLLVGPELTSLRWEHDAGAESFTSEDPSNQALPRYRSAVLTPVDVGGSVRGCELLWRLRLGSAARSGVPVSDVKMVLAARCPCAHVSVAHSPALQILFAGLQRCPWSKALILDGVALVRLLVHVTAAIWS
jgi:hypothetical protein